MLGAGILLLNSNNQILLLLRDNKTEIPFPGMWDIPGGGVEEGELPEEAVRREMIEELGINNLGEIELFKVFTSEKTTHFIFWKRIDLNPEEVVLMEGQRIEFFNFNRIKETELAFGFSNVLLDFYKEVVDK
jgi:8-oxo-dGTP diphosphatase